MSKYILHSRSGVSVCNSPCMHFTLIAGHHCFLVGISDALVFMERQGGLHPGESSLVSGSMGDNKIMYVKL